MSYEKDKKKKKKKRITSFNFQENMMSGQGAHVSLVEEGANGQECLIMKSAKQVTVELSMIEFLQKFFGMWYEDAEVLAKALGYETSNSDTEMGSTYEDYISEKAGAITFLKSNKEIPEKLPQTVVDQIKTLQDSFEVNIKKASDEDENLGDTKMSKEELEKQLADMQKAKDSQEALLADMQKAKDDLFKEVEDMKKAKRQEEQAQVSDVVKGYNFVEEADREAVVEVLMATENSPVLLKAFEAARDMIKSAIESEEGEDLEDNTDFNKSSEGVVSAVQEIIKNRKSQ